MRDMAMGGCFPAAYWKILTVIHTFVTGNCMSETKITEKIENIMSIVKQNLTAYAHFLKTRIKLYEMTREYNMSVYELGHQFYATAKSGLSDTHVFSSSIDKLKELENKVLSLKEALHQPKENKPSDAAK